MRDIHVIIGQARTGVMLLLAGEGKEAVVGSMLVGLDSCMQALFVNFVYIGFLSLHSCRGSYLCYCFSTCNTTAHEMCYCLFIGLIVVQICYICGYHILVCGEEQLRE